MIPSNRYTMTAPLDLSLQDQARLIATGAISAVELTQAALDRIDARDEITRAVVDLNADALALAREIDAMPTDARPPLAGLAFGVKDIIDVAGQPTRCGSHAHDVTPVQDAAVVARLRQAGMIPLAKLATYEYALTGPAWDQPNPPARNPWNPDHITGGSSSGSAAAVAAGLMRVALGTDTGGSIRAPAAYCGIVGLKPTHGLVPNQGCFPLSPGLDVIGPLAGCVADAALVLDAMAPGAGATHKIGQDIKGMKIAYCRDWFADDPRCDPAVLQALDDTAAALSLLGAQIHLTALPAYDRLEAAGTVILQAEALAIHRSPLSQNYARYGVDARRNLLTGAVLDDADVTRARQIGVAFRAAVDVILAEHAAILLPTTLGPAPAFADFADGPVWTAMRTLPFNMSGHPALSLPCGLAANGLPLGCQLVAKHRDEATLCQIAYALEQAILPLPRPL
jgi:aspartyl-tRNA(Asn)/glutamyl-tRNA(Gln) amidotransferase subunit A